MKISIVIPVYNAERTIDRLLKTIYEQTYKNYEVVIIDDGSTDKTSKILLKYQNKDNTKIIFQENKGVGKARKIGFQNITGDLVFFCDSDDYLPNNNILNKINSKFVEKNCDILMFDVRNVTENGIKTVNCFSKDINPGKHSVEEINDCFLFGPLFLKIMRKEKLDENCFVESNNFEDTYTTYKYLNNCSNFYYDNEEYYVFDETANTKSLTKIKDVNKFINTIDLVIKIYNESKLKNSCCISAFNYYIYLISLIEYHKEWDSIKVQFLKNKMEKLENIFLKKMNLIYSTQEKEKIDKYNLYKFNKKIILVDGISTSGKSTLSDKIFKGMQQDGINVKWFHEESKNDINLNLDLPRHDNIDDNQLKEEMNNLLDRWKTFYHKIKEDNFTYILDSNFFKNIHDYLLVSNLNGLDIKEYYNKLIDIFEKDDIFLVFLKRNNIKESLTTSFANRGEFWTKHYKKFIDERIRMSKNKTNESIFEYEQKYQIFIEKLFDQFEIKKLKLVTDDEEWCEYIKSIFSELNLTYTDEIKEKYDYSKYIGNYFCENWDIEIFYDKEEDKLFLSAFRPKIELEYINDGVLKLSKFPITLKLCDDGIVFVGDSVWDMENKFFMKNKNTTEKIKIL